MKHLNTIHSPLGPQRRLGGKLPVVLYDRLLHYDGRKCELSPLPTASYYMERKCELYLSYLLCGAYTHHSTTMDTPLPPVLYFNTPYSTTMDTLPFLLCILIHLLYYDGHSPLPPVLCLIHPTLLRWTLSPSSCVVYFVFST